MRSSEPQWLSFFVQFFFFTLKGFFSVVFIQSDCLVDQVFVCRPRKIKSQNKQLYTHKQAVQHKVYITGVSLKTKCNKNKIQQQLV